MMDSMTDDATTAELPIRDDMIRLGQLLKLASLAEDGVEAKALIDNGLVQVNGEIERG
jgi:ribosome-associated protein